MKKISKSEQIEQPGRRLTEAEATSQSISAGLKDAGVNTPQGPLRESQQWYSTIFESSPIAIGISRLSDSQFVDVNPALVDLLGYSRQELIGHTPRELQIRVKVEEGQYLLEKLKTNAHIKNLETVIRNKSGKLVNISVAAQIVEINHEKCLLAQIVDITERKRAEEALRASDAKLAAVIENLPVGIWMVDKTGRVTTKNAAADQIWAGDVPLSSGKESYVEYPAWDVKTGKRLEVDDYPLARTLQTGLPIPPFELRIRRFDGKAGVILMSTVPLHDPDGSLTGAVGINVDITERKQAEEELQRMNDELERRVAARTAELAEAQRIAKIGNWRFDATTNRVHWADELHRIFEIEKTKFGNEYESFLHCVHPDDRPLVQQTNRQARQTGLPFDIEYRIGTPSGNLKWIHETGYGTRNSDGEVVTLLGIAQDITVRKQMEESLRASDARIRSIFMDSPLGMALLNPAGEILASNPALQKMLGYSDKELKEKPFDLYSHPDDAADDAALHKALLSGEAGHYRAQKRFVRVDGQVRWSELTMSRVRARNGEAGFAFAMLEDITEQKLDQEALLKSERLAIIGRLGASLAHEINNPLQAALGCLGLAEEIIEDGMEIKNYLQIAMEELDRAAGIVSHLRDLGHPSEAKEKALADLNALMEKTLIMTRKRCENQSVLVEWNPSPGLPMIAVVADNIQQVFLNLVLNAVEAMHKGGVLQIKIESTQQPAGISVTVADNGTGIEPERLHHIFEPFHTTRPTGMGLGLYISQKIVESHGGRIEVKSRPGAGSTFTVWLPG